MYSKFNQQIKNISDFYTDYAVRDFNGTSASLNITRGGYFGPISLNGTRLYKIQGEYQLICGNRLAELQYIYNDSLKISDFQFMQNVTTAQDASKQMNQSA